MNEQVDTGVIEEKWMFTIRRYRNGKSYATAPFLIGQNVAQPKAPKQAPAPLEVSEENKASKPLWEN